jgi:glycosyltransferase involved in cell wall biosynthesis
VRAGNWWYSKLPPLLAVAYAYLLLEGSPPLPAYMALGASFLTLCGIAWFAHALNDLCDIADDARGGKANRMAGLGPSVRFTAIAMPAALALGMAWVVSRESRLALQLAAANLLIFTLYSAPPLRLKERRWWGVAADALGAHVLPMLFVLAAMPGDLAVTSRTAALAASALVWSLAAGLRGILVHQFADRHADLLAGVTTVAATEPVARARKLVLRVLLPIEAAALLTFVAVVAPASPLVGASAFLFVLVEALKIARGWKLPIFEPPATSTEGYRPLLNNDAYELWLPISLALGLAVENLRFAPLPPLQVALFYAGVRQRVSALRPLLKPPPDGRARRDAAARRRRRERPRPPRTAVAKRDLVIGATHWGVNGVNLFSANLARGLAESSLAPQILLTESSTRLVTLDEALAPRPADVPFVELDVSPSAPWGAHWGEMIRHLESRAPCIYVPNSDWRHSCVSPLLSDRVGVVGIVHSDDPLHYDHVRRLGPYWNSIVAVSELVAERTAEMLPAHRKRIVVIPIGARVTKEGTERPSASDGSLRLVYHCALDRHRKRVLDLPRIMAAVEARQAPARLTIAGGGVDDEALRAASRTQVERGKIEFAGAQVHDEIPRLLLINDVYLVTSEFEGMPNALIEAMGHGLVPVASRDATGVSDLVRDGENGFLVPAGDVEAFADRLLLLQRDPDLRARLSSAAYASVQDAFRLEDMVCAYEDLFEKVLRDMRRRRFARPHGELAHAPPSVEGTGIFPVDLPYHAPGVGRFPSHYDYESFRMRVAGVPSRTLRRAMPPAAPGVRGSSAARLRGVKVIVASPLWLQNDVNAHSLALVSGLRRRGVDASLLLTEERTDLVTVGDPRLPIPDGLPVEHLPVARAEGWGGHWGAVLCYLEERAPCVFLPTFDWRHACVVPRLSREVVAVASAFGGDPYTLEQVRRLAPYWNAVVVPDTASAEGVRSAVERLAGTVAVIPQGVDMPEEIAAKPEGDGRWELLAWTGPTAPISAELVSLVAALRQRGMPVRVSILRTRRDCEADSIPAGDAMPEAIRRLPWPLPRDAFAAPIAVIAWLDNGPLPLEVWRAMGWGCVPLVATGSGVCDSLRDGDNGEVVTRGDQAALLDRLARLLADGPRTRDMALAARHTALLANATEQQMLDRYLDLFESALQAARDGSFARPPGPILAPPPEIAGSSIFPVALEYEEPGVGRFPSAGDYAAFVERSAGAAAPSS